MEAYRFNTASGWLTFMVTLGDTTIIAYREDGTLTKHEVTGTGPVDDRVCSIWFPCMFVEVHEGMPLGIVGRLRHPTDTLIGFYFAACADWLDWGYVWNVDHPECSHWAPAEDLAASIDPEDLEHRPGRLACALQILLELMMLVEDLDPRAAALLTAEQYRWSEYGQLADAVPKVTQTIEWMQEY